MNLEKIRDFILRNSKIVFPIILIVCVAITVTAALNAGKVKEEQNQEVIADTVSDGEASEPTLSMIVIRISSPSCRRISEAL